MYINEYEERSLVDGCTIVAKALSAIGSIIGSQVFINAQCCHVYKVMDSNSSSLISFASIKRKKPIVQSNGANFEGSNHHIL
jgi:hypothetical protein